MRTEFHQVADVVNVLKPLVAQGKAVIGTDFDGTLIDFADTPDGVKIPTALREDLAILHSLLDGGLAGITGRDLEFVDQRIYLPETLLPCSAGHGAVFRGTINGDIERVDFGIEFERARSLAHSLGFNGFTIRIEEKPTTDSLALHYQDGHEDAAQSYAQQIAASYNRTVNDSQHHMGVGQGRLVFEIKPALAGKDKGFERFIRLHETKTPIFFGDTDLDKPAMHVAKQFGGFAIGVGPNPPEECDFYLPRPADARQVIAQLVR